VAALQVRIFRGSRATPRNQGLSHAATETVTLEQEEGAWRIVAVVID
jgi:hypothetical protein